MTHLQSHAENLNPISFCGEKPVTAELRYCDCVRCLQLALDEHEQVYPYFGFSL